MNLSHPLHFVQRVSFAALLAVPLLQAACRHDQPGQTETGEIMLSVDAIPEDVSCIRVSVTGEFRDVTKDFDVTQGQTFTETFSGLPVGSVVFSANAYASDCSSVTKSTVPTWISEDKTVNVVQGKSSSVTLTLFKNGRAKVTVEFADQEDGGADTDARSRPDAGAGND